MDSFLAGDGSDEDMHKSHMVLESLDHYEMHYSPESNQSRAFRSLRLVGPHHGLVHHGPCIFMG